MTAPIRPSPRCRRLLLEVSRYLDGELTPARRRRVGEHIDTCECCGTMAARLRQTVAACREEGSRRLPRAARLRAAARIRALVASDAGKRAASRTRR
jgi:anti-sigma factor RsiW